MRVKKSDVLNIIQEELDAVRRALPAWLGEEIDDEQIFFDMDYDAGFKGSGEGSSTSQTLAYQLGAYDRENGLEYNASEHPPRGPLAKVNEQGGLEDRAIEFMLKKAWKAVEGDPKNRGGVDPNQMDASDAINLVLDTVDPQKDWVIQFLHMDSSKQENIMQNVMGQKHGSVPIVSTQGTSVPGVPAESVEKQRDYSWGDEEEDDHPYAHKDPDDPYAREKEEKPIPAYNPDTRRQQLQKRNPGRKYSLEEQELELEPGMQVKDLRNDQVGTVQSVVAGEGGGGAVIKLENGEIVKTRAKFLEPVGGVEEASFMIGDREVQLDEPADYPSPDEFAQLPSGEQQEIFDRALADYKENRRDMDPREEAVHQERLTAYERSMEGAAVTEAGDSDPYKQGDPSVQDSWSTDELIEFLKKHPEGVLAKELAMAFGGQWQMHAAKLQKLVRQGILKKDVKSGQTMGKFKNRYVLADVNETLRDIFGFTPVSEDQDFSARVDANMALDAAYEWKGRRQRRQEYGEAAEALEDIRDWITHYVGDKGMRDPTPELESMIQDLDPQMRELLPDEIIQWVFPQGLSEVDQIASRLREKAMRALAEQGEKYQSDRDIPQEDVERVISFLQDQRGAGVGELDLGSIMQDMGMEDNTVKLIMVDRLGYEIEDSESDPRGKINFNQGVDTMGEKLRHQYPDDEDDDDDDTDERGAPPGYGPVDEEHEPGHEEDEDESLEARLAKHAADSKAFHKKRDMARKDKEMGSAPYHYQEAHEPGHEGGDVERYLELYKESFGLDANMEAELRDAFTTRNPEKLPKMLADLELPPGQRQMPYHIEMEKQAGMREATNKLREHVGRFMKVTLREEARNK